MAKMIPALILLACSYNGLISAPLPGDSTPDRAKEIGIPHFRNYTPKETGGDVQNWAVVQDHRGVMYFGNNSGVLEYDGVSWRLLPVTNSSAVRALAADDNGRIYVGAQGEFGYLAPALGGDAAGQMQYFSLRDSVPAQHRDFADIAKCHVTTAGVYFQALDRLFLWPRSGGMRVWRPALPFHLSFVVRDRLYIRQPGIGLLEMAGDSLQLAPGGEAFAALRIYFMAAAGDGKILIGTREKGLFWYDGAAVQAFPTDIDAFLSENQIYYGAVLPNGSFAVATLRRGVAIVDQQGRLQQLLNKAIGIQDEGVKFIYSDRQGGTWLALENGITRVETPGPLSRFDERAGVSGAVESILRHRGRLYLATGQGVYYLRPAATHEHARDRLQPAAFKSIEGIASQSWSLLSAGEVLLAGVGDGIYEIHGAQAKSIRSSVKYLDVLLLHRSRIDTNRVYIGLRDGLAAMRRSSAGWREEGRIEGIDEEVRSISETPEGVLWLGTRSQGYIRVDFSTGFRRNPAIEKFDSRHGLPENMGFGTVFSLFERELFSTDRAIYGFDRSRNRFFMDSTLVSAEAARATQIGEVVADAIGNVWMQLIKKNRSEIGVARRQPDGSHVWQSTPFNRFADFTVWDIYPEADGVVWFGGPDGLMRYDANVPKDYAVSFSVLVRKVMTIDRHLLLYDGSGAAENSLTDHPRLAYADNSLRFEFAAPSYEDEAANQYQYFLEGFDKNWSEWTKETKKDYTNLFEGDYLFRVRAKNIHDHVSAEALYSFRIQAPFYRTWLAYAGYAGLMVLIGYGFTKYRTHQLVQRSRALERTVQQRTEEIRQQAEELETLDGIVKNINQEVALEDVLRSLLDQGLKLFPQAEKASVLMFEEASGLFKFAAAAGYDLNFLRDISFTPEQLERRYTVGSEAVGEGVYIVRNLQNLYIEEKLNTVSTPVSVLAMAAVWHDRIEAYLIFDNLSNPEAFSHSDARKLSRFRSHAISAIVKAKILQELQEKNSEIIRTQQQLVMQEKLASLGALTAGIAHEIKNPLNFVNNFAELSVELAKELRDDLVKITGHGANLADGESLRTIEETLETLIQNTEKINQHGKRADSIVRGMLQHSRTQTGEREDTDLNALLQQAVNLSYHGIRAQDNGFNIAIDEDYDATMGEVKVMPQDLSRVFLNIINNACYAAQQKKKTLAGETYTPTLSVRTRNLGDKLEIRIRDNGTGIPPAVREKIFNPFFTTKPAGQGTGLGLSISYDIIQKHGGKISLETEEGSFTEFIIQLPRDGK